MPLTRPDILFIMTDQQRFDTIAALANPHIYTPNIDRLVRRGIAFSNAYATCPVCVAARYMIRTGCEPATTRVFSNAKADPVAGQPVQMEARCGPYLGRVMSGLDYRTFGIGKFHTYPWDEDVGYETLWRSEETYHPPKREGDDYGAWLAREHPEFDFLEQPMGERSEMYYLPQRSPLPAELGTEWWMADRAVEEIAKSDDARPFFGFISFVGPHPPLAPPIPFNRMYDPDRMPEAALGKLEEDHLDEEIPYMRYAVWGDAINATLTKIVKARYYGEITYLDHCFGRILDAIEARPNSANTLVCFFSDHGDLLGDQNELSNCITSAPGIRNALYAMAVRSCRTPGAIDALNGDKFRAFPFRRRPLRRIYQFDRSRGVLGFPDKPEDALQSFDRARLKPVK